MTANKWFEDDFQVKGFENCNFLWISFMLIIAPILFDMRFRAIFKRSTVKLVDYNSKTTDFRYARLNDEKKESQISS